MFHRVLFVSILSVSLSPWLSTATLLAERSHQGMVTSEMQIGDRLQKITPVQGTQIEVVHGMEIYGCDVILQNPNADTGLQESERIPLGLPYDLWIYYRLTDVPYDNPSHYLILKSEDNSTFYSFPLFSEFGRNPPLLGEARVAVISVVPRMVARDLNVYLSVRGLQHVPDQMIRSVRFDENPGLENVAAGRPCEFDPELNWSNPPNASLVLTDGEMLFSQEGTVGWVNQNQARIDLDLGDTYRVRNIGVKAKGGGQYNIYFPQSVQVLGKKSEGSGMFSLGRFDLGDNGIVDLQPKDHFYANTWYVVSCDDETRFISVLIWPRHIFGCDEIVVFAERN